MPFTTQELFQTGKEALYYGLNALSNNLIMVDRKKLMQRKDVESLICATDAWREGELIFRLVYHQCGCKKPVERLWISSMEDSAIREGFQKLRCV